MTGRFTAPIALLALAGATELVVFTDGQGALRVVLAFSFLLLAPGWALVRIVDPPLDLAGRAALAVAVSVAVDMAIATALLYLRAWSAELALTVVVLIVVVSVLLDLPQSRAVIERGVRRAWSALNSLGRA
jgi:uncharacterized membrane protein